MSAFQYAVLFAASIAGFFLALGLVALIRRILKPGKWFDTAAKALFAAGMGAGFLAPILINHFRPPRWLALAPPGAGFAVDLPDGALVPSEPEATVTTVKSPFGPLELHTFQFTALGRPGFYIASYVDYPADAVADLGADGLLDEVRDALAVAAPDGRLAASASRPLGPHPGRDYRFETDQLVMTHRSALIGRRLILMSVAQNRRGLIVHKFEGDGKAFLESLRIQPDR